jgi:hypothetical protein
MQWLDQQLFLTLWQQRKKDVTQSASLNESRVLVEFPITVVKSHVTTSAHNYVIEGIGNAEAWYGAIESKYFMIEWVCDDPCFSIYLSNDDGQPPRDWQFIKQLEQLPFNVLAHLSWISNHQTDGKYSLFYKDGQCIQPFWTSSSLDSVQQLKQYLNLQGDNRNFAVALTEQFYADWAGYKVINGNKKLLCRYPNRYSVERAIQHEQKQNNQGKYIMGCEEAEKESLQKKWGLFRLDDNDNTFLMERFTYQVDAEFAAMAYEAKGHHQSYWVEPVK